MKSAELNREKLTVIAKALGDLLPQVTFVGGCTTILLVDEAAHSGVRHTEDVDIIVDVASAVEYLRFSKKLRKLGFQEDQSGPICRWLLKAEDFSIKLDVMPVNKDILGFSNLWYADAIQHADHVRLSENIEIQVVSPEYFLATKFEAFKGRGKGDYFSHDLEDIVFVMENRANLILELNESSVELKRYLAEQAALLLNDEFLNVLPGLLENPQAESIITNNLKIMSSWGNKKSEGR